MLNCIINNPYRILGVLSNSPLKERVGNQNKLAAFAKVGKDVVFPNDFIEIVTTKPTRLSDDIAAANIALNLDKDQLKHALFWFIIGSPMDSIALKHLQAGNKEKALEIFEKKETFSSLINKGVLSFINGDFVRGLHFLSKVIHTESYRLQFYDCLNLGSLQMQEDELAGIFISELLIEIQPIKLLAIASNEGDRSIISTIALGGPMSVINSEVSIAKNVDTKNSEASLAAGTKLMNNTKEPLRLIKEIAGAQSSQYQLMADSVAKQVLQCGINYYNNASDSDWESPRRALVLVDYALSIAIGQLLKDRCRDNYEVINRAVVNLPPSQVVIETRKVKEEISNFCKLPEKISHSVTLLNRTKPLLNEIKSKIGLWNTFYISLSTQIIDNALHNVITEVNTSLNLLSQTVDDSNAHDKKTNVDKIRLVLREAWRVTILMDTFDMECEFKTKRYNPNRKSLQEMCESFGIDTNFNASTLRFLEESHSDPRICLITDTPYNTNKSEPSNNRIIAYCTAAISCTLIGGSIWGAEGWLYGAIIGIAVIGPIAGAIFKK